MDGASRCGRPLAYRFSLADLSSKHRQESMCFRWLGGVCGVVPQLLRDHKVRHTRFSDKSTPVRFCPSHISGKLDVRLVCMHGQLPSGMRRCNCQPDLCRSDTTEIWNPALNVCVCGCGTRGRETRFVPHNGRTLFAWYLYPRTLVHVTPRH